MSQVLENLLPFVRPFAPGASELAATSAIRRAAIDLCQMARCWRLWIDNVNIVAASQPTVTLTLPDSGEVIAINGCRYNGVDLMEDCPELRRANSLTWTSTGTAPVLYGTIVDASGLLQLTTLPRCTGDLPASLRVRVQLRPSQAATLLPDILFREFGEGIGHGAAAILAQSDEEGVDQSMFKVHTDMFSATVLAAAAWARKQPDL